MTTARRVGTWLSVGFVVHCSAFACASPTTDTVNGSTPALGGSGGMAVAGATAHGGAAPLAFGGGNNGASGHGSVGGSAAYAGGAGLAFGGNSGTSSGGEAGLAPAGGAGGGSGGASGTNGAGAGGETGSGPCANPVDVTGGNSGGFKTAGAVCLRTSEDFDSLGCSNMEGRTIKVNGVAAACGDAAFAPKIGGYNYFDISAGTHDYASIYWFKAH